MKLSITDISNQSLGIAKDAQNNKVFVKKAVIGDQIEVKIIKKNSKFTLAEITKIIAKSQFRKEAECKYFDDCGGCSMQHIEDNFYQNFKIQNFKNLIVKHNIPYQKEVNFTKIGQNSRRKVKFHLDNSNNICFYKSHSKHLVAISNCLMLEKEISNFNYKLQVFLNNFDKNIIKSVQICSFDNILDVVFELKITKTSLKLEEKLILFAKKYQINLGLQINREIIPLIQIAKPKLHINNFWLEVPNNIFLQATKNGLKSIITEISEFIVKIKAKEVADIYAGIGSYSFGVINETKNITAFEGIDEMTDSINKNAKKNFLSDQLQAFTRDLFINPILSEELQKYDLIIINPPRNGAESQIKEISKLQKSNITIVSCDFNSFFRDLSILSDNGFKLEKLSLIDQFYYTYHIEIVAHLRK